MTTIAWDGKTLAADLLGDAGGLRIKVHKLLDAGGGRVLGIAGNIAQGMEVADWLAGGELPNATDEFEGILIEDGKAYLVQESLKNIPVLAPHAIGTGRNFAIAAMHLGKTAEEAIEVAAEYDINTGMGVDTWEVEDHPFVEQDTGSDVCIARDGYIRRTIRRVLSAIGIARPKGVACAARPVRRRQLRAVGVE